MNNYVNNYADNYMNNYVFVNNYVLTSFFQWLLFRTLRTRSVLEPLARPGVVACTSRISGV